MKLKAFAKINLSLRVFEKRPDGFHNLESIMQSVSLYDIITISKIPMGIEVTCDDPKVPTGKDNIVYKAVELFFKTGNRQQATGNEGIKINIEKRIPMAAGLAGGSSDAAAVLFCLNGGVDEDLLKLGAQVGSDVPFCLTGGTCLVKGRGEIVEKLDPWIKNFIILVTPDICVSTKWAYDEFDNFHISAPEGIENDLEPVVVSKYGIITEIKEKLLKLGCDNVQMSGSGPTVFGMVKDKSKAEDILREMKKNYSRSFVVEAVNDGVSSC
jgi:4-diphosphocytidyl-2-C-methyl-D-erythritol kinase